MPTKTRSRSRDKRKKRTKKQERLTRILGPEKIRGKGMPVLLCGHALNDIARS